MNVRQPQVTEWLQAHDPDILVLQEIKQLTEKFPGEALLELGYHSIANGQKTYNGVAVISKEIPNSPILELPDFEDPQRRVLACSIALSTCTCRTARKSARKNTRTSLSGCRH